METSSAWKDKSVVEGFINGKRAAIPNAEDQLGIMLHMLYHSGKKINRFIDLGAGDGILGHLILEQFPEASGYIVDFSTPMLQAAEKRLANYKKRVKLVQGDLTSPDWKNTILENCDKSIDVVVSGYCIHHLQHGRKYELYQEIYEILGPKGLFVNIEHVASRSRWGEMLSDEAFINELYGYEVAVGGTKTKSKISIEFHQRPDKKDNILLPAETQCQWLREIGFRDVDTYFKCHELAVFGGRKG